jgi:hypothetical protein
MPKPSRKQKKIEGSLNSISPRERERGEERGEERECERKGKEREKRGKEMEREIGHNLFTA